MTDFLILTLVFIVGASAGSSLNSLIHRLHTLESLILRSSYCPNCRHPLKWYDLFPLLSFLTLKGKCRYCQNKISWQYPLVEISTAVIFLLIFNFQFSTPNLQFISILPQFITTLYLLTISCFLIVIFVYDLKHYIIPDKIVYPAIATAFLYHLFRILSFEFVSDLGFRISDFRTLINPLAAAVLASGFFLSIVLLSRGKWMGVGDIKLAFLMGIFLGFPNILVALFLAFFIGAIMGIGLIIFGKKSPKEEVPFGPLLVTGTFMALLWGQRIVEWYLNLLQ